MSAACAWHDVPGLVVGWLVVGQEASGEEKDPASKQAVHRQQDLAISQAMCSGSSGAMAHQHYPAS